jgi:DNA ligase D-like protein (predicted 3'-phosphoesterase)
MTTKTQSMTAYHDKRDFDRTPEPQGGGRRPHAQRIFVIQKHDAQTLHYDFRLEIEGVLKSWAVPKGPSTDTADTRLAIPTEDHPLEYADFEGTIPADQYGGGTVMVWDTGTIRNLRAAETDEPLTLAESYVDGKIEVWLEGQKLQGGYALIRTDDGDEPRWLLKKMADDMADARRNPTNTETKSALSGRTMAEIAAQETPPASR